MLMTDIAQQRLVIIFNKIKPHQHKTLKILLSYTQSAEISLNKIIHQMLFNHMVYYSIANIIVHALSLQPWQILFFVISVILERDILLVVKFRDWVIRSFVLQCCSYINHFINIYIKAFHFSPPFIIID